MNTTHRNLLAALAAAALIAPADLNAQATTRFTVRIDNVSNTETFKLSNGKTALTPVSPGVWALFKEMNNPLFTPGQAAAPNGLERQAEEGNASALFATLKAKAGRAGTFTMPMGADKPGGLLPGHAYEFTIEAMAGDKLALTMMFAQSNDLFFGPANGGIALFDAMGKPVMGDVTAQLALWDAGSEVNQEPGVGPDQAPRQKAPNTGTPENGVVHLLKDQFSYPKPAQVIRVTIEPAASR